MALARCRECGRDVSTEAASCPHCGAPRPTVPETGAPAPSSPTGTGGVPFGRPPAPAPAPRPTPAPRSAPRPQSNDATRVIIYGALVLLGIILIWGVASQSAVAFTLLGIVALIALVIVYFYPTIVAYNRRHTNKEAIFVLNLLLGWSIIGWAVALTWAVKKVER